MRFQTEVIPTELGVYGPFKSDEGTPREGTTIPYVTVIGVQGGTPMNAVVDETADMTGVVVMQPRELVFELRNTTKDGAASLKLRTLGPSKAAVASVPKAA